MPALDALGPAVAHVGPQHAGQQEARRHGLAFADAAVGVLQRRLHERLVGPLHHHVEQRIDALGEAQLAQLLDRGNGVAGLQQLEHFVEQAALRHVGQQPARLDQRRSRLGFHLETQRRELGRETDGADDAHRVFAVARGRIADHAQRELLGVADAVVVVDHDLVGGVVVHGVHGEVAARRVFLLRAPDVVAQHAAAGVHRMLHARELALAGALVAGHLLGGGVVHVGAEGRDLDHLVLAAAAVHHVHDAKAPPDDEGAPEERLDLLGRGVGGHVEVLGAQPQQQVAHRAAHHVGLVAGLLERGDDVPGTFVDQGWIDLVNLCRHLLALAEAALALCAAGRFAEQLVDEFLDHCWLRLFSIRFRAWIGSAGS